MNWIKLRRQQIVLTFAVTFALVNLTSYPTRAPAQPASPTSLTAESVELPLKLGMRGEAVKTLQINLSQLGLYKGRVTGNFDSKTEAAVKAFQQQHKLSDSGVVDSKTWHLLGSNVPKARNHTPVKFVTPSNEGAPGNREAAATRAPCPNLEGKPPLTALIPATYIGLTTSDRPTFWFYVPYSPKLQRPVEFVLYGTDNNNEIYKTTLRLQNTPGIVSLNLPETVPPLESGKKYKWRFSFLCNLADRAEIRSVEGWVKRVTPNPKLQRQLESAAPRSRIALYAANGFWYDTLSAIAQLRRTSPQDATLAANWASMLQSVGLDEITSAPIVACCTREQQLQATELGLLVGDHGKHIFEKNRSRQLLVAPSQQTAAHRPFED
jgi:peptidoglycan hydrolase-like protein with peptidoglycan-binding domain